MWSSRRRSSRAVGGAAVEGAAVGGQLEPSEDFSSSNIKGAVKTMVNIRGEDKNLLEYGKLFHVKYGVDFCLFVRDLCFCLFRI